MNRPISIVLAFAIVAVAACGGSTGGLGSVPSVVPTPSPGGSAAPDLTPGSSAVPLPTGSATPSTAPGATPNASPPPSSAPARTMIVRAYFALTGEPGVEGLVPVLRVVPESTGVAKAAMTALLAGPTAAEVADDTMSSAIPAGTRLLAVSIRNGIATVDLSTEFDSGGGTASMQYRLAQVVYTLTQFATVKSVVFKIEGQTVTVFGGEGIVLDGPVNRADYEDQLPAIFVDRPAYGAAFASGGPVVGNANVFEATFRVAVLDSAGKTLADDQVMASCGTGCRGTFDVLIAYTVSKAQWGTLRVYEPSAKDGSPENVRNYPVWLTPKP